jgi:phenylacetate-CoA ligase
VADGEEGELVFTSLTREAMPVIRYRTRDLTRLLPPTARSMRRIGKITGRSDDMLIIRGVNLFPTQVEEIVLAMPELGAQYQLIVSRDGHMDKLEIVTEVRPEFEQMDAEARRALSDKVKHAVKSRIGVSTTVTVRDSGQVERTVTGKARRVVDQRPKA